jgi:hypothetical protein
LALAIVRESSEGNDRLEEQPNWLFDVPDGLFIIVSMAVAALPAWLAAGVSGALPFEAQLAVSVSAWLLCFPIALLSALEQNSAFGVLSPRVAASVVRCAGPWLLFYVESAALAAAAGFVAWKILTGPPRALYLLPWLIVAAGLLYMRLLGRLAWWLAESMPAPKEDAAASTQG